MNEKLLVPDIGEFEHVEVIEVLVKPGDQLNINDPVISSTTLDAPINFKSSEMVTQGALPDVLWAAVSDPASIKADTYPP